MVEILVVFLLSVMLIAGAYMVFSTGFISYRNTSERVDAQSQFRLVVDILEKEVGNAKKVKLVNVIDIPVNVTEGNYIYLKKITSNKYELIKKNTIEERAFTAPYAIEKFTIDFQMDPTDDKAQILRAYLRAKGTDQYLAEILIQNTNITETDNTASYDAVYYEDY